MNTPTTTSKTSISDKVIDASYTTMCVAAALTSLVVDTAISLSPEQEKLDKLISWYNARESVYLSSALEVAAGFVGMLYSSTVEERGLSILVTLDGIARLPGNIGKLRGSYALEIPYGILKKTYNSCRKLLTK